MPGLNYRVGADITAFESAMSRARDTAIKRSADMLQSFQGAAKGIDLAFAGIASINKIPGAVNAIGTAAKLAVGGFVALEAGKAIMAGLQAATEAATAAVDEYTKIGTEASRLDFSTNGYQALINSSHRLRVETDELKESLDKAHKAFTDTQSTRDINSTTPVGARSPFLIALQQQQLAGNVSADQVGTFKSAVGDEERYKAALAIIQQLYDAGRRVAALDLGSQIFNDTTLDRIRRGELAVGDLLKAVNNVADPDLVIVKAEDIARAQELQRRLDEAQHTLDTAAAEFRMDLAQVGMKLKEDAVSWKETIAAGAKILIEANRQAKAAAEAYGAGGAGLSSSPTGPKPSAIGQLGADLGAAATGNGPKVQTQDEIDRQRALDTLRGSLTQSNVDRAKQQAIDVSNRFFPDKSEDKIAGKVKTPTAPTETLDAIETYINGLEKTTAGLKGEVEAIGLSNSERQVSINLRKAEEIAQQAGRALSDEEVNRIKATSAAMAEYRDKVQDAREAQEFLRQSGGEFLTGFAQDVRNGATALDALNNALQRLVARLEDKALNTLADLLFGKSGGTSTGLFGNLFSGSSGGIDVGFKGFFGGGGGYADGGYTGPGGRNMPAGVVHRGEVVFSQDDVRRHGGPAVVEALRKAPGYAGGGVVAMPTLPPMARGVVPVAMPAAGGRGGGDLQVNVMNAPSQPKVTKVDGPQGRRLDIEFGNMVGGMIANGQFDKQLSQRFGMRAVGK